jgi:hypothetical protein
LDVLVEKPIADSVENATAMIESAEEMDRHLMVGNIERFNPGSEVKRNRRLRSFGEKPSGEEGKHALEVALAAIQSCREEK